MGLSFPLGSPIPGEGMKVMAVIESERLQDRMRSWSGPQGVLTDHLLLLDSKSKSWEECLASAPNSKTRIATVLRPLASQNPSRKAGG